MVAERKNGLAEKILEELYHLYHAKVGVKVAKRNGEIITIAKSLGFTKVEVFGKDAYNIWVNIKLVDIADVVAA